MTGSNEVNVVLVCGVYAPQRGSKPFSHAEPQQLGDQHPANGNLECCAVMLRRLIDPILIDVQPLEQNWPVQEGASSRSQHGQQACRPVGGLQWLSAGSRMKLAATRQEGSPRPQWACPPPGM